MPGTRKLGRTTDHRRAMLRGLVTYLLENGQIETTLTRAKEVAPLADKMITLGKKNTLAARRMAMAFITKEDVVKKLFDIIAPKYENRVGGYTQIYKLGPRRGDAAEMALIRLVEEEVEEEKKKSTKGKKPAKAKSTSTKRGSAKIEPAPEKTEKTDEAEKAEKVEETTEKAAETVEKAAETADAPAAE